MRVFIASILFVLFSFPCSAQFSPPVEKMTSWGVGGVSYTEIVVSVNVPLTSCFLGCGGRETTLRGKLWLPTGGEAKPPYKLFVSNHGAQYGVSHFKTAQTQKDTIVGLLLQNGYAILLPYRKGFSADDLPKSDTSAETYESTWCSNDMSPGLASAVADVKAYLKAVSTRDDLDMKKIIMSGQSRGAVVALALAAEEYPGIIGVVNRSGMWVGESRLDGGSCSASSYNTPFFKNFGERIKVPTLSIYGGKDQLYGMAGIKNLLSYLGKHAPADHVIIEDAGHTLYMSAEYVVKLEKFLQMTTGTKDTLK